MNSPAAAIPGRAIGTITRSSTAHSLQPSMRAASAYSFGMVRKNCRNRKIENASPSRFGRMSGQSVPVSQGMPTVKVGRLSVGGGRS